MPAYVARATFKASDTSDGSLIVSVLHLEVDQLSSPFNPGAAAADVNTWLGLLYRNILMTTDTLHSIVVDEETVPPAVGAQAQASVELAGTRSAATKNVTDGICAMTTWGTGIPKRYARGRWWAPPCRDDGNFATGGLFGVSSPYYVAVKAFADAYAAGHSSGSTSYAPAVFSRTQTLKTGALVWNQITAHQVGLQQRFLRKRTTSP